MAAPWTDAHWHRAGGGGRAAVTPGYSISFYLPTIIVQAGFSDAITANLMASPVWLVAAAVIILNA